MGTKDKQYSYLVDKKDNEGFETLGLMSNGCWDNDPRRFAFYLSRYKFVSKLLEGKKKVLEIGCGDGWASRIVRQSVSDLTVSDFDSVFIEDAKSRYSEKWPFNYRIYDFTKNSYEENYDGIYLLDVFEHINPEINYSDITNPEITRIPKMTPTENYRAIHFYYQLYEFLFWFH
mgnify:CR=1 FL=1